MKIQHKWLLAAAVAMTTTVAFSGAAIGRPR